MIFIATMVMTSKSNARLDQAANSACERLPTNCDDALRGYSCAIPMDDGRYWAKMLQNNPHFRDHVLFYEYFHGDTGRGIGAAHQTGWTGLIALLLHPRRDDDPSTLSIGSDQA